jgi:hypothetical protein
VAAPTLDDVLALLPDNATGAIDAADLRAVVTALWAKSGAGAHVDHLGVMAWGPDGWSSTRDDVGVYTVHHTLGRVDYAPIVTPLTKTAGQGIAPTVMSTTEDSFTFQLWNSGSGELHDADVFVVVAVN